MFRKRVCEWQQKEKQITVMVVHNTQFFKNQYLFPQLKSCARIYQQQIMLHITAQEIKVSIKSVTERETSNKYDRITFKNRDKMYKVRYFQDWDKMTSGNLKKVRAAHGNSHVHTTSTIN